MSISVHHMQTVLAATQDKALQRIEKLRNEKRTLAQKMAENDEKYKKDIAERDTRIKQVSDCCLHKGGRYRIFLLR
uniref:V-type proton ATPase subunit G n=1 Tax=Ascaris lumbricoides TaxID=6252 RepID=A0A0M3HKA2_ASCLU